MLTFKDDEFKHDIQKETGLKPPWAAEAFPDLAEDVKQSLRRIGNSPFVTKHESVRGFIFDVATGKLNEVGSSPACRACSHGGKSAEFSPQLHARRMGEIWLSLGSPSLNLTRLNSLFSRSVRGHCLFHFDTTGDITSDQRVTPL